MSSSNPRISIIVPTYNERDNIQELFQRIKNSLGDLSYEIIVVDDNSPDGTAEYAESCGKELGLNVTVIKRPCKMGLISAVIDGLKIAKGEYVVVMDADLQHPPEVIPKLISELDRGYDMVIASRYVKGGSVEGWSSIRRIISKAAILLAHILIPQSRDIKDPVSGFFAFKVDKLGTRIWNEEPPRGFKILLYLLSRGDFKRVGEVPYVFKPRTRGSSKLGMNEILNYAKLLLTLSEFRAIKFGIVGAVGTVVNLGLLAVLIHLLRLESLIAHPISIEVSIINNYILNEFWTFRRRGKSGFLVKLLRFHGSSALAVITQFAVAQALSRAFGLEYVLAAFIGIIIGYLLNYVVSEVVVWK